MPLIDPIARRKYHKEYMHRRYSEDPEFKERHLARVRINDQAAREKVKILVAEFRYKGCQICGEDDECCLDAHHLNSAEKDFNLGSAWRAKMGPDRVKQELAKCLCLCSNCHRKFHAGKIKLPILKNRM